MHPQSAMYQYKETSKEWLYFNTTEKVAVEIIEVICSQLTAR